MDCIKDSRRDLQPPGDGEGAPLALLNEVSHEFSNVRQGLGMVHKVPLFAMQKNKSHKN